MKSSNSPLNKLSFADMLLQRFLPDHNFKDEIAGDFFWQYYKPGIELVEEPPEEREFDHTILKHAVENGYLDDAQLTTAGLFAPSAFAADLMAEFVRTSPDFQDLKKKYEEEKQKDPEKAEEIVEDFLRSERGKAEMLLASKLAQEGAEETRQAMEAVWGNNPGVAAKLTPADIKRVSKKLDLKVFAEILGALGERISALRRNAGTHFEIFRSKDPNSIFITELAYVTGNEPLRTLKSAEFVSSGLPAIRQVSKEGRSAVVLVDSSASMTGTRNILARAFALALYRSTNWKRFVPCLFGERTEFREFPAKEKLPEFIEFHFDGGTNFDRPLEEAVKMNDGETDVVFITDGECAVSPKTVKKFKEANMPLYTIYIEAPKNPQLEDISLGSVVLSENNVQGAIQGLAALANKIIT